MRVLSCIACIIIGAALMGAYIWLFGFPSCVCKLP